MSENEDEFPQATELPDPLSQSLSQTQTQSQSLSQSQTQTQSQSLSQSQTQSQSQSQSRTLTNLICTICRGGYYDARRLPCFHSFCCVCIREYVAKRDQRQSLMCPLCRTPITIAVHEVDSLPQDTLIPFDVRSIIEGPTEETSKCVNHPEKIAKVRCVDGCDLLCEQCLEYHRSFPVTSFHKIKSLSIEDSNPCGVYSRPLICTIHPGKPMDLYCDSPTCQKLLCYMCALSTGDHRDHDVKVVEDAFPACREKIQRQLESAEKCLGELSEIGHAVQRTTELLEDAKDAANSDVAAVMDEIIEVVKERKKELENEIEQIISSQMKELSNESEKYTLLKEDLTRVAQYARNLLDHSSKVEVLSVFHDISRYLEGFCQDVLNDPKNHLRTTAAHFEQHNDDQLREALRNAGRIRLRRLYRIRNPINLVGQMVWKFGAKGVGDGQFLYPRGIVYDHFSSSIIVADHHRVQIFRFGQDLEKSPEYAFTIGGFGTGPGQLSSPQQVATNQKGTIAVADYENNRIQLFSITGTSNEATFLNEVGRNGGLRCDLKGPRGVAFRESGDLVIADTDHDRVVVFHPTTQQTQVIGRRGTQAGEFLDPFAVATDQLGRIYIADRGNSRIQVFESDLRLRQMVGVDMLTQPTGLFVDREANIWVADKNNHRIRVFSHRGDLIHTFGERGKEDGKLSYPWAISSDDAGRVFISDNSNHRVVAFE